jgi:hypothetical protein
MVRLAPFTDGVAVEVLQDMSMGARASSMLLDEE